MKNKTVMDPENKMESKNEFVVTNSHIFRIFCKYCKKELPFDSSKSITYHKKCEQMVLVYNFKLKDQNNVQFTRPFSISPKSFIKECAEILSLIINN